MHYSKHLTLAGLFHLLAIGRADIIAFSGNTCDGDAGSNVACDGSCHSFSSRHSFQVRILVVPVGGGAFGVNYIST